MASATGCEPVGSVASRVCAVAGKPVKATPHARRNSRVRRVVGTRVGTRSVSAHSVGIRVVGAHSVGTRGVGTRGIGMRSVGARGIGTRFLPGGLFGWWRATEFQTGHSASAAWEKPDSFSAGCQARHTARRKDYGSTGCRGLALTFRM